MDQQTREQCGCALAAETLRTWGVLKLRARGVSMLPTLWPGDVLTVHSLAPEQVEHGDIVLFMRQGRFFIHRVASKDLTQEEAPLVTRGDCMSEDDPPVGRGELLGRVVEVRRPGSVFRPARRLTPARLLLAGMLCRWHLFRRVGLRLWNSRYMNGRRAEARFVRASQRSQTNAIAR